MSGTIETVKSKTGIAVYFGDGSEILAADQSILILRGACKLEVAVKKVVVGDLIINDPTPPDEDSELLQLSPVTFICSRL
jgi:hypothetical protein